MSKATSLYVHIPFCRHKCDYCDFFSVATSVAISDDYIQSLLNEALFYKNLYKIDSWSTIYIGGGTPSLLSSKQISTLVSGLLYMVDNHLPKEVTLEMNPESVTEDKIQACIDSGINRLSLGLQSRKQSSLSIVKRICTVQDQNKALEIIKKKWDKHLNLDVIAGLPDQSTEEFLEGVNQIIAFNPDHISMYSLMIEEGTALFNKVDKGILTIDEDLSDEQWLEGRKILLDKGFYQYEVSNFSKENCQSIHNMTYWNQENYIGIGCGATGTMYSFNNDGMRWTDTTDISRYISFWLQKEIDIKVIPREVEILDNQTLEYEFIMMGFRTILGINSEEYNRRFLSVEPWNGDLRKRLYDLESKWPYFVKKGYAIEVNVENSIRYSLTDKGLLFLNELLLSL